MFKTFKITTYESAAVFSDIEEIPQTGYLHIPEAFMKA